MPFISSIAVQREKLLWRRRAGASFDTRRRSSTPVRRKKAGGALESGPAALGPTSAATTFLCLPSLSPRYPCTSPGCPALPLRRKCRPWRLHARRGPLEHARRPSPFGATAASPSSLPLSGMSHCLSRTLSSSSRRHPSIRLPARERAPALANSPSPPRPWLSTMTCTTSFRTGLALRFQRGGSPLPLRRARFLQVSILAHTLFSPPLGTIMVWFKYDRIRSEHTIVGKDSPIKAHPGQFSLTLLANTVRAPALKPTAQTWAVAVRSGSPNPSPPRLSLQQLVFAFERSPAGSGTTFLFSDSLAIDTWHHVGVDRLEPFRVWPIRAVCPPEQPPSLISGCGHLWSRRGSHVY